MRKLIMHQIDAFADKVFRGNPAAVIVLEADLPDTEMQAIAMENNLAETAFLRRIGDAWTIRWFTPIHEAAFCGHATLAAAHALVTEHGVTGELVFKTRSVGTLRVQSDGGDRYSLDVPCLMPEPLEPLPAAFELLFPEGICSSFRNFENLFVELSCAAAVTAYVPDMLRIADLAPFGLVITGVGGTTHTGEPVDFVSRYFAPAAGIPEDPVTGSTHATLVPFWSARLGRTSLSGFQASARGGRLSCQLEKERVILSGGAVTFMQAEIRLPD
jgi:PhzF family phenazine biosynthesis protein